MTKQRRVWFALLFAVSLFGGVGVYGVYQNPAWLLRSGLLSVADQPLRRAYEKDVAQLASRGMALRAQGLAVKEVARLLYEERRALGVKYKEMTPRPLRERIYEINRQRYGDPLGPSWDFLCKKHTRNGVVDYQAIIDSAARTNDNVNRLLGGK